MLKCELLSGANNEIGAVRLLTLSNGGTAREQLIARQIVEHIYDIGLNNLLQMTSG